MTLRTEQCYFAPLLPSGYTSESIIALPQQYATFNRISMKNGNLFAAQRLGRLTAAYVTRRQQKGAQCDSHEAISPNHYLKLP